MEYRLTDEQRRWRDRARAYGQEVVAPAAAELDAHAAAKAAVAARTQPEFVLAEEQGETRLIDFDTAELDSAGRVPLTDR